MYRYQRFLPQAKEKWYNFKNEKTKFGVEGSTYAK